jgi:hypothetical protein
MIFVEMYDHLGVRHRIKAVSPLFKDIPEFYVIENLTVEDDPASPVFIVHGLPPAFEVDDTQSGMSEPNLLVPVEAKPVWTAMT